MCVQVSLAEDPADFVEATLFTKDQGVVMEASFVDAPTSSAMVNNCNWWFKPWFYCHIRDMYHRGRAQLLDNNAPITEFIPTYQYIFRHNRAVFWSLNDQLPESIGNHWLFRLCLGWLAPPKVTDPNRMPVMPLACITHLSLRLLTPMALLNPLACLATPDQARRL